MSRSPSHLLVWPNSTSNAFPVGGMTLPSGRVISPVKVPVAWVTTVIHERDPQDTTTTAKLPLWQGPS